MQVRVSEDVDYLLDLFHSLYCYEVTITMNPMLWNRVSADDLFDRIIGNLKNWLMVDSNMRYKLVGIGVVKEYTKARMPHYHCVVCTDIPLPPEDRVGMIKGLQRLYGRSTFKDVLDGNGYFEYMVKDLRKNQEEKGFSHLRVLYTNLLYQIE